MHGNVSVIHGTLLLQFIMQCVVNYGNKHILGALVGALSDAMYGCERGLIKKKYSDDISFLIEILLQLKRL